MTPPEGFDSQPYADRFLAAGGTSQQLRALIDRLGTAIEFADIIGEGEHRVAITGVPPEAAAVVWEWARAYRDHLRAEGRGAP